MGVTVLATGTPEVSRALETLTNELLSAMGPNLVLDQLELPRPGLLVLNIQAIAPHRGAIPNATSLKRSVGEFWSSYGVDYDRFAEGDRKMRLDCISAAVVGAIEQVPISRMTPAQRETFVAAMKAAIDQMTTA